MKKMQEAWKQTIQHLGQFFGSDDSALWRWGKYHKDVMHHLPFGNTPLRVIYDRTF